MNRKYEYAIALFCMSGTETVDIADTRKEARELLNKYEIEYKHHNLEIRRRTK